MRQITLIVIIALSTTLAALATGAAGHPAGDGLGAIHWPQRSHRQRYR